MPGCGPLSVDDASAASGQRWRFAITGLMRAEAGGDAAKAGGSSG